MEENKKIQKAGIRKKRALETKIHIEVVGPCPNCGADVHVGTRAYCCSKGSRNGCNFRIAKNRLRALGRDHISPHEMKTMLDNKPAEFLGLVKKNGEYFDSGGIIEWSDKWGWGIGWAPLPSKKAPLLRRKISIKRIR